MSVFRVVAFLFILGAAVPLGAQTRDRGPIVLELPASTRALGLGNSFALGFGDSDALFYQPGLLDRVQGLAASIQCYSSHATLASLSAGREWYGGGVGLGVQLLTYQAGSPTGSGDVELLSLPENEGSLRAPGEESVSELVISAGYGRRVMGLRVGVVGKLLEQRYGALSATTAAADLGIAATPGPLTVGLAVQNLGPDLPSRGTDLPLATRFALGASTRSAPVGPLDLSLSSAVTYRLDGDVIPSLGLEVGYWPISGRTFVARLGYRHLPGESSSSPFNFGGAFFGDDLILEYAFQGFESGNPSHRFSIGWR